MQRLFLLTAMVLIGTLSSAQTKDETLIRKTLTSQEVAWNEGNFEGYMQGYWQNDSLMFIGKGGITYGWEQTLVNYKKKYPDTTAMGKLHFELIEIKKLSANYFFVTGKWHLKRAIGNLDGVFTLLFRKIKSKWVIVRDHSS
jgi:ketosteroid isomerase-like protein